MTRFPVIRGIFLLIVVGISLWILRPQKAIASQAHSPAPTNLPFYYPISKLRSFLKLLSISRGAKGFYVHPKEGANWPGIVMIHEIRGLRPEIKTTVPMSPLIQE